MIFVKLDIEKRIDPFYFALEKVMLDKLSTLNDDICFIWDVFPAVIIGKHQLLEKEVNLTALKQSNTVVYRRPSGGGAVFSDYGCIKYSFISKKPKDVMYKLFLDEIIEFLKPYIDVSYSGRNDLIFDGYKFSGNAYYQTKNGNVLHGTILYDTDMSILGKVLNPSVEKLKSKGVDSVKSRVTNLINFVKLSREDFRNEIEKFLDRKTYYLTNEDLKMINEAMDEFNSDDYIHGKNPAYEVIRRKRFPFGEIEVHLNINKNIINGFQIYGDFFEKEAIEDYQKTIIGQNIRNLKIVNTNMYIEGMTDVEMYDLILGGNKIE